MKAGDFAGLSLLQRKYGLIGVQAEKTKKSCSITPPKLLADTWTSIISASATNTDRTTS